MSLSSEITRISNAKTDISNAIQARGVAVSSSALIDSFAALITQIPDADANEIWSGGNMFDEDTAPVYNRYINSAGNWSVLSSSRSYLADCESNRRYLIQATNSNLTTFRIATVAYSTSDTIPSSGNISAKNAVRLTGIGSIAITTDSTAKGFVIQVDRAMAEARNAGILIYELTSRS